MKKRILIIGASSAIATACARLWAREGADFFLVGRTKEKLDQVAADLISRGGASATTFVMDASDVGCYESMLTTCVASLHQVDLALIAHGTLPVQSTCETNVAAAIAEFNNNGTSVIALLTVLSTQFSKQKCGSIAVISSVAGDRGRPSNYLYGAAKAAVSTFCEGLRVRMFKEGVHVMTVKPGFVNTPMTQGLELPRMLVASPDKIAQMICRGVERKVNVLYAPKFWSMVMFVIRAIPDAIFKRLSL